MLEADKEFIAKVNEQLTEFHLRETELLLWINKNGYDNSEWEEKNRELNNVRWKIKQLIKRKSNKRRNDHSN